MTTYRKFLFAAVLLAVAVPFQATGNTAEGDVLDRCAEQVRDDPGNMESYRCYWIAARSHGLWEESIRELESILSFDSENHAARLYLAYIEADRGRPRAETLYREAADGFAEEENRRGEVYARLALAFMFRMAGRTKEVDPELDHALQVARLSGSPALLARVQGAMAGRMMDRSDYGRALGLLVEAEGAVFPEGPPDVQSNILSLLGRAYWSLGRRGQAIEIYEREATLLEHEGRTYEVTVPRYNIALLSRELYAEGAIDRDELLESLEQILEQAVKVRHRALEARSLILLGTVTNEPSAAVQFERALDICSEIEDAWCMRRAMGHLAEHYARFDPLRRSDAAGLARAAVEAARNIGDLSEVASAQSVVALLPWLWGDREEWIEESLRAIDAVERIRDLQPDDSVRAGVFSRWTFPYYRLSGHLLEGMTGSPDPEGDLDLAFRTVERMRSRTLLDELERAGVSAAGKQGIPVTAERDRVLREIAAIQRRLGDRSLTVSERAEALSGLDRLERRETALRAQLATEDPDFARLRTPRIAAIQELQEQLSEGQVLVSYQLATGAHSEVHKVDNGGSWVILLSRDSVKARPLGEKRVLEEQVSTYLGMLRSRDGSEVQAALRLGEDLLGSVLGDMKDTITSLIISPDGCLHRLPFESLRLAGSDLVVGVDYEVSYVPSATLWSRWRRNRDSLSWSPRVLAMADPVIDPAGSGSENDPAERWGMGEDRGSLPYARREARVLAGHMASESRVMSGSRASEAFLKSADLAGYGILHFAAHAVVDPGKPDRSAILLAPGAYDEDGFLQSREIVDLDMNGKVVLLTACRSASGPYVWGEGIQGLARAFFEAGAVSVVGSLLPLRDDEAYTFVDIFAGHIARGTSLAAAVRSTRSELIADGAPAAAWAGLVVLGDADIVLVPGGLDRSGLRRTALICSIAGAAALLTFLMWSASRRRRARVEVVPKNRGSASS